MKTYTRLTVEDREQIHLLVNQGKSNREIASILKRSHSTISRQINFAQQRLNTRPRKVLNWKTPLEAFKKLTGALKT